MSAVPAGPGGRVDGRPHDARGHGPPAPDTRTGSAPTTGHAPTPPGDGRAKSVRIIKKYVMYV